MHTPEYQELLRQAHINGINWGIGAGRHAEFLRKQFRKPIRENKLVTVLDYGCGKANLSKAMPELKFTNYDPGVEEFKEKPGGSYDLIVCTHVLEHIEPELLMDTIKELDGYMQKYGFIEVPHLPATQILPDGRNAHLTVQDHHWWKKLLKRVWGPKLTMRGPGQRCTGFIIDKTL